MIRTMRRFVLAATVLGLMVGAAGKSKANIVTNGGFETGNGVIGGTSNFQGWTLSGDWYPWTYIVGSTFGLPGGGNYEAQLGTNYSLGFLSQTLTTVPGQSYTLDYWMRTGHGGEEFQTYWNGTMIADLTNIPKQLWTEYTFTVTATGSSRRTEVPAMRTMRTTEVLPVRDTSSWRSTACSESDEEHPPRFAASSE